MEQIKKFFRRRVAPAPLDVDELMRKKRATVNKFVEENETTLMLLQVAYPEHKEIRETRKILVEIKKTNNQC